MKAGQPASASGSALAVLALCAAVALAGCSGGGAGADDGADVDFTDLGLEATATTGVLRGVVVDSAVRPIAGVRIAAAGPERASRSAETNAEGAFGLDGLAPGDWFVTANKSGYVQTQQSAAVVAGLADPPIVKFLLEADASTVPFVSTFTFDGFIECSFRGVVIGFALCTSAGLPNDRFTESYEPTAVPDWWQSEMVWESTQAFGSDLSLDISCLSGDPCPNGQVLIARQEGPSPLTAAFNRTTAEAFLIGKGQPVDVRVFAFGRSDTDVVDDNSTNQQLNSTSGGAVECVEWPAVFESCMRFGGVGLIAQQSFKVYSNEFHFYTPPEGWRFVNDGPFPPPA
jgi:hypothetical protein